MSLGVRGLSFTKGNKISRASTLKLEAIAPAVTVVMCRVKVGSIASQHTSVVLVRIHSAHNASADALDPATRDQLIVLLMA